MLNFQKVQRYKTYLEFGALVVAIIYALLFIARTWAYPSGQMEMTAAPAPALTKGEFTAITQTQFTVGQTANLQVTALKVTCEPLDKAQKCLCNCGNAEQKLSKKGAVLARGDRLEWACSCTAAVPTCMRISQTVEATATGIAGGTSQWWTEALTCGGTIVQ